MEPTKRIWPVLLLLLLLPGCRTTLDDRPRSAAFASRPSPRDLDEVAAAHGYGTTERREEIEFEDGGKTHLPFELEVGECYLFGARGGEGIKRISMRITRDGSLVSADLAGRSRAWADTCAEESFDALVSLEVAEGAGTVDFGAYHSPREDVIERVGPPLRPFDPRPGPRALLRLADRALGSAGYGPARTVFEGPVESIDRQRFDTEIPPGICGVVSAYASGGITDLDLQLSSSRERLFSDRSRGPISRVPVCAEGSESWSGELIVLGGEGEALVAVNLLSPLDLEGADGATSHPILEGNALMMRAGMTPVRAIELAPDEAARTWSARIALEGDRCYGLIAGGVSMDKARVEIPPGDPADHIWKGPGNRAVITFCLEERREVEIVISAAGDAGPTAILYAPSPRPKQVSDIDP